MQIVRMFTVIITKNRKSALCRNTFLIIFCLMVLGRCNLEVI